MTQRPRASAGIHVALATCPRAAGAGKAAPIGRGACASDAAEKQRAEKAAVEAAAREAGYESYEAYKAAVLAAEPAASAAAMGETASGHASGMTRSQSETDFLNRSRFVMRGKLKV